MKQPFENFPELAAHIEHMGWHMAGISLSRWDKFLTSLNDALAEVERLKANQRTPNTDESRVDATPIWRLLELDPTSAFALVDIAAERVRQIEREDWTPQHDDKHAVGVLATAGACYAAHKGGPRPQGHPLNWPWHKGWWKPYSQHRNWVRGGALIVAELARHLRISALEHPTPPRTGGGG